MAPRPTRTTLTTELRRELRLINRCPNQAQLASRRSRYASTESRNPVREPMGTTATPSTKSPDGAERLRITDSIGLGSLRTFLRRLLRFFWAVANFWRTAGEWPFFHLLQSTQKA